MRDLEERRFKVSKSGKELISLLSNERDEEIVVQVLKYYKSIKGVEAHEFHKSNGMMINQFTPEQGNTL